MKNEVIIVGSGGFSQEVIWLINDINQAEDNDGEKWLIKGIISSTSEEEIMGVPVLGDDQWAIHNVAKTTRFVVAIGNPNTRQRIASFFEDEGFESAILIHPAAILGISIKLGAGTIICAGAILTTNIQVGNHVIINLNSTVGHDAIIGNYTTISPGVNVSGNVNIGDNCEVGSGAVLLPGIEMKDNAILGAGAIATKNLHRNTTYIGIPARPFLGKLS